MLFHMPLEKYTQDEYCVNNFVIQAIFGNSICKNHLEEVEERKLSIHYQLSIGSLRVTAHLSCSQALIGYLKRKQLEVPKGEGFRSRFLPNGLASYTDFQSTPSGIGAPSSPHSDPHLFFHSASAMVPQIPANTLIRYSKPVRIMI